MSIYRAVLYFVISYSNHSPGEKVPNADSTTLFQVNWNRNMMTDLYNLEKIVHSGVQLCFHDMIPTRSFLDHFNPNIQPWVCQFMHTFLYILLLIPGYIQIELSRVHKFAGTMLLFWPYGEFCELRATKSALITNSAWGLTMAARTLLLPISTFLYILICGFIGASLLHRFVLTLWSFENLIKILTIVVQWVLCALKAANDSFENIAGAGCIWNDILDQDIDRQVGKRHCIPMCTYTDAYLVLLSKRAQNVGLLQMEGSP